MSFCYTDQTRNSADEKLSHTDRDASVVIIIDGLDPKDKSLNITGIDTPQLPLEGYDTHHPFRRRKGYNRLSQCVLTSAKENSDAPSGSKICPIKVLDRAMDSLSHGRNEPALPSHMGIIWVNEKDVVLDSVGVLTYPSFATYPRIDLSVRRPCSSEENITDRHIIHSTYIPDPTNDSADLRGDTACRFALSLPGYQAGTKEFSATERFTKEDISKIQDSLRDMAFEADVRVSGASLQEGVMKVQTALRDQGIEIGNIPIYCKFEFGERA